MHLKALILNEAQWSSSALDNVLGCASRSESVSKTPTCTFSLGYLNSSRLSFLLKMRSSKICHTTGKKTDSFKSFLIGYFYTALCVCVYPSQWLNVFEQVMIDSKVGVCFALTWALHKRKKCTLANKQPVNHKSYYIDCSVGRKGKVNMHTYALKYSNTHTHTHRLTRMCSQTQWINTSSIFQRGFRKKAVIWRQPQNIHTSIHSNQTRKHFSASINVSWVTK